MSTPFDPAFRPDSLSVQERAVVDFAGQGMTDAQIAQNMGLSVSTINSYWVRIRGKLGQLSRTDLVVRVLRSEMLQRNAELRAESQRLMRDMERLSADLLEARALNQTVREKAWHFWAFAHLPEAALVTASPANVVFANRRAHRLYGAASGELEGLTMRQLTAASTPEGLREPCRPLFEADGPEEETIGLQEPYYARRRDGSNFRAVVKAQRFDAPDGPFVALTVRESWEGIDAVMASLRQPLIL